MAELWDNPIQTDGFEFVEYAVPDPRALGELFERMGFQASPGTATRTCCSTSRATSTSSSRRAALVRAELCSSPRPERLRDGVPREGCRGSIRQAPRARRLGRREPPGPGELSIPAIKGIATRFIYLVDRYPENDYGNTIYDVDFKPLADSSRSGAVTRRDPAGAGLRYVDHLTHNVHRGRMKEWPSSTSGCSVSARSATSTSRAS